MQIRVLGRVCAALVAISLFAVPCTAFADDAGPVEWAAWISDSLQGLAVDYFATKEQLDNATWLPATIGSWSIEYVTSQEMAKDVRSLPDYQDLYGSNPWDTSAAIRSYDGGDLVSVLTPEGLYNAWLWLHGGVPPRDEQSGGSESFPSGGGVFVQPVDSLGVITFQDGTTIDFSSVATGFNTLLSRCGNALVVASLGSDGSPKFSTVNAVAYLHGGSYIKPEAGAAGFVLRSSSLASALGYSDPSFSNLSVSLFCTSTVVSGDYEASRFFAYGSSTTPLFANKITSSSAGLPFFPDGSFSSSGYSVSGSPVYVAYSGSLWAYGAFRDSAVGPAPAPEPVDPVAPSSPSVDSPQSDGPVQTDVNITVTLPDGSTTVVVAPSADLQPVVQWLSIINANIVAWGGNISQWLAEIWKTLDAFRMAVDNWSVSILSAIDSLGNFVPSFDSNETNYWNTVVTYNNDVWGTARNIGQQDIQNDLDLLKGKFPFSIPWDLFAILLLFDADPVAPVLDIPLVYYDGSVTSETIHVDLSAFDSVMSLWRRLSLVGFVFALAVATRRLLSYVTVANDLVFG